MNKSKVMNKKIIRKSNITLFEFLYSTPSFTYVKIANNCLEFHKQPLDMSRIFL